MIEAFIYGFGIGAGIAFGAALIAFTYDWIEDRRGKRD